MKIRKKKKERKKERKGRKGEKKGKRREKRLGFVSISRFFLRRFSTSKY